MGSKGGNKKGPNTTPHHRGSMTLRQESALDKQGHGRNVKVSADTMCKLEHLKSMALWAATKARIPSLAAFYGERYAATSEAASIPRDPSLFYCERCESILEPGQNCTVRIEPNKSKRCRREKKSNTQPQNFIVYTCQVCNHRNKMRGTPRGYVKEMCADEPRPTSSSNPSFKSADINGSIDDATTSIVEANEVANVDLPIESGESDEPNKALTPLPKTTTLSLLESKKRKRNGTGAKKKVTEPAAPCSSEANGDKTNPAAAAASNKRKRKSWTSLKEIAESSNHHQRGVGEKRANLSNIPFLI